MFSTSILFSIISLCLTQSLVSSASISGNSHDATHDCISHSKRLPSPTWYQTDDHPVHKLFKRGPADEVAYPEVGSPAWSAAYPQSTPDVNELPQLWVDALDSAVASGKIPDVPVATATAGNPAYPNGVDPMSEEVCSTTWKCRLNPDNIYDAPDGVFGISFDDGPLPPSRTLYEFLQDNNQSATHFFIGINILQNPNEFTMAFNTLHNDIAVHTWTHPHMTTMNNLEVVAQLGWTMEIIHNSTGGRLPKYWRPPFGDSDNRVNAIAKEIFGLKTIIWNQDTEDWSLSTNGTTPQKINASMTAWITGPKQPGLNILEHELTDQTVQVFIDAYPLIKENGWKTISIAQMDGESAYRNAKGSMGNVISGSQAIVLPFVAVAKPSTSLSAPGSTSSSLSSLSSAQASGKPTNLGTATSGAEANPPTSVGQTNQSSAGRTLSWSSLTYTLLASPVLLVWIFASL